MGKALITLGLAGILALTSQIDAGVIIARNRSPPVNFSEMYFNNISGASEGLDVNDSDFIENPAKPSFNIYSQVEGNKLSTNSKPVNTDGFDFDLGVNDFVANNPSILRFQVIDATDLVAGQVKAWDKANPGIKYDIPLDGSYLSINLPDLINQPAGEYAHWYLQLREQQEQSSPVSEPSGLALMLTGIAAASKLSNRRGTDPKNYRR